MIKNNSINSVTFPKSVMKRGVDVNKIMNKIRIDIEKDIDAYLYKTSKDEIDTVWDSEFLKNWGEVVYLPSHSGRVVLDNSVIKIVAKRDDYILIRFFSKKDFVLSLSINNVKLDEFNIVKSNEDIIVFRVVNNFGLVELKFTLPKNIIRGDFVVYDFQVINNMNSFDEYTNFNKTLKTIDQKISLLHSYKDPFLFLPKNTRFYFFKKMVLKLSNIFLAPQIAFNGMLLDTFDQLLNNQKRLNQKVLLISKMVSYFISKQK